MNIKILDKTFDKTIYNRIANHPLQTWEWGEARAQMGTKVVRLGVFDAEESTSPSSVFQMTLHPLPYTKYEIGYIPRSEVPPVGVLEYLSDFGKKNNIVFIKFEPDVKEITNYEFQITNKTKNINSLINSQFVIRNSKLTASPHPLFPEWTMVLDLTQSESEILAKMKPKTRYNVKLAQRKGVEVKEVSNPQGFKTFADLYFETCKRQQYHGHSRSYHQIIWETLQKTIDISSHILIAYLGNEPLAAYQLFLHKNKLYYPYGGTSLRHRNVMAPNLLMWESIRFGLQHKANEFDMWGSLGPGYDEKHAWAGFTKFKEGYGAQFRHMPGSYDLVVDMQKYKLYNALYKVRSTLLKYKII